MFGKKKNARAKSNNNRSTNKPIKSNSSAAKKVVRDEIKAYFKPHEYGVRSTVDAMKKDADAYNADMPKKYKPSNYAKGAALVDGGSLACYYDDQRKMLAKIYGKDKVKSWDGEKVHNTYKHLIGREYAAMIDEKEQKAMNRKRKEKR